MEARRLSLGEFAILPQAAWQQLALALQHRIGGRGDKVRSSGSLDCVLDGKRQSASLIARAELLSGDCFSGPAVISEYSATTLVPAGWRAQVDAYGQILLTATQKTGRDARKN